jgi:hypothetical protein
MHDPLKQGLKLLAVGLDTVIINTKKEKGCKASIFLTIAHVSHFWVLSVSIDPPASCKRDCRKRTKYKSILKK